MSCNRAGRRHSHQSLLILLLILLFGFVTRPLRAEQERSAERPDADGNTGRAGGEVQGAGQNALAPVTWLGTTPRIDGVLDENLRHLPVRRFPEREVSADVRNVPEARWRIAYGADFLYLYLEADAAGLTFRDRAYQNGDGFHLLIAAPRPDDAPTDEFYVLACSAVNDRRLEWSRRIFWYYNVDTIFKRTGDGTRLEFSEGNGIISFELLLPWADVPPYHPWISDAIGFNLCFVKALPDGGRSRHSVLADPDLRAEYRPRRYARLTFAAPDPPAAARTCVRPDRRNIVTGAPASISAATLVPSPFVESIDIVIESPGGTGPSIWTRMEYTAEPGLTRNTFTTPPLRLPPGEYFLRYSSAQSGISGETGLSVRRPFEPVAVLSRLAEAGEALTPTSRTTLAYRIYETAERLDALKPYESCRDLNEDLEEIFLAIEAAEAGRDIIAGLSGFVRQAYRSELDGSLQPYLIKIPRQLEPGHTYPLIVYLHGSASTEEDIRGFDFLIPDDCFGLGPFGRGPSTSWCVDDAQTDIAEAVAAVVASYPIDPERIILTGFSMGGYGVLRTWLESPQTWRALAVLSGEPHPMSGAFPADRCPDLRTDGRTDTFEGIPIFIYHGDADRNCPYETMQAFAGRLGRAGAAVTFVTGRGLGHAAPDRTSQRRYLSWLREILF